MPRCQPMVPVIPAEAEKNQQLGIARFRSLPHVVVLRHNSSTARRLGLSNMTVGNWRRRCRVLGLPGLHDELRPRRPGQQEDLPAYPRPIQPLRGPRLENQGLVQIPGDCERSFRIIVNAEPVS